MPNLSTANTRLIDLWEKGGTLHAVISLDGGPAFPCSYNPQSVRGLEYDQEMAEGFSPADVEGEVLGQMAQYYDLETMKELA